MKEARFAKSFEKASHKCLRSVSVVLVLVLILDFPLCFEDDDDDHDARLDIYKMPYGMISKGKP